MTNTEILKHRLIENDVKFTNNINLAIWILEDGSMIDGDWDCGMRAEDHRIIEAGVDGNRYDDDFWDTIHDEYKLIRLVPETKFALIKVGQELTSIQKEMLSLTDYEIEEY